VRHKTNRTRLYTCTREVSGRSKEQCSQSRHRAQMALTYFVLVSTTASLKRNSTQLPPSAASWKPGSMTRPAPTQKSLLPLLVLLLIIM
jgi:hypothetical protein